MARVHSRPIKPSEVVNNKCPRCRSRALLIEAKKQETASEYDLRKVWITCHECDYVTKPVDIEGINYTEFFKMWDNGELTQ